MCKDMLKVCANCSVNAMFGFRKKSNTSDSAKTTSNMVISDKKGKEYSVIHSVSAYNDNDVPYCGKYIVITSRNKSAGYLKYVFRYDKKPQYMLLSDIVVENKYRNRGKVTMSSMKSVSRRQFIKRTAGEEIKLNSNGETALNYFEEKLKFDTLYCLDEPENSMSPKMQLELVKTLEKLSHYCGCQFIIATHSPFILALENARIYNLDETPVEIRNWWELENTRIYYDFFKKHSSLFQ